MPTYFRYDERLGIRLPNFDRPFEHMSEAEQAEVIAEWEVIRARIPDQVEAFEHRISDLLTNISDTEDWDQIVRWFDEISDIASRIAELNTWNRVDPVLTTASPSR